MTSDKADNGLLKWLRDFEGPGSNGTNEAADVIERLTAERDAAVKEMEARELHHFEAEKALTDLLELSWGITRESHCSHLGADIRFLIPADVLSAHPREPRP